MRVPALALLLGLSVPGSEAFAVERLTGEQMRQLVEGNTATGRYSSGETFSEYHHPDGRASGHNRGVPNTDACWITTPDAVCYYYGPQEKRRTYCFTIETSGDLIVIRSRPSGRINGLARVEKGDPYDYAAKKSDWVCDGLISRAPGGARLARR